MKPHWRNPSRFERDSCKLLGKHDWMKWEEEMKRRAVLLLSIFAMATFLLAACGDSEKLPVSDPEYADYVGCQFSGADPWGGSLAITVRTIVDGKMEWTFTDAFDEHTLYQEQSGTAIQDGIAEYEIQGKDVENDKVTFSYQGTLELRDEQIAFTFQKGSVTTSSPEGGSDARMAEALAGSGSDNTVVLKKAADDSLTTYTVQEGDSIHSIAERFGTTTKELAILNQTVIIDTAKAQGYEFDDVIEYANYLFPGEVLLVPRQ